MTHESLPEQAQNPDVSPLMDGRTVGITECLSRQVDRNTLMSGMAGRRNLLG